MLHWLYDPRRKINRAFDDLDREKKKHDGHEVIRDILLMAKENGLRPSDLKSLEHEIEPSKIIFPNDNFERMYQLIYMEKIMMADLNMDTAELDFLIEYARYIELPFAIAPLLVRDIYFEMRDEKSDKDIILNMMKRFGLKK
ncbi:MAG: hypothetical protein EAZ27_03090 [Cytophagales bacterium]|nr:MAG: hypothetical protein EAZ27_03090 [Cytophagales bacterium]